VYVKLLELMGVYRKIVLEGRIDSGISPNAKTLLDGICEVLVSRLSQFYVKFPLGLGSPVRAEKIQIIEEAVMMLAEKIKDDLREPIEGDFAVAFTSTSRMVLPEAAYEIEGFEQEGQAITTAFALSEEDIERLEREGMIFRNDGQNTVVGLSAPRVFEAVEMSSEEREEMEKAFVKMREVTELSPEAQEEWMKAREKMREVREQQEKELEEHLKQNPEYKAVMERMTAQGREYRERLQSRMFEVLTAEQREKFMRLINNPPEYVKELRKDLKEMFGDIGFPDMDFVIAGESAESRKFQFLHVVEDE